MDDNSFFSLDRLVEFGMGMAMAQQMVSVMNNSMASMSVPGVTTMQQALQTNTVFYVAIDNKSVGPLSHSDLINLVNQQRVTKDTLAWIPGMSAWQRVETVPEILKIIALCPPKL